MLILRRSNENALIDFYNLNPLKRKTKQKNFNFISFSRRENE